LQKLQDKNKFCRFEMPHAVENLFAKRSRSFFTV